ncbi:MAG: FimV/HubP family polar landmark protein [Pseudomonas sp.]|uniref:FimV/HubP family polar landmark protein n=1 Tax=Pseudomonas sp. TaxID=306 RepID=UPI003398BFFF
MAFVRSLVLCWLASTACYSSLATALGLGEITLHSALNQPLEARIELLEVGELSSDEVLVRLAPAEAFQRSGVERFFFLNDLRFTPVMRGRESYIRVVSGKPVREPYLNFLVELERPVGRLLREYTVLLDPPLTTRPDQLADRLGAPAAPMAEVAPRRAAAALPVAPPPALQGQRYRVVRGDSLWSIAQRLQADRSQAGVAELMRGIHALNPQAFAGGNIDRLQLDADLLLPDSVQSPTPREPRTETIETTVAAAPATAAQPVPSPAGAGSAEMAAAQAETEQALAEGIAQREQLQQTLADLQAQLQALQAQMLNKDQQLAALQAQLTERQQPAAPALPPANAQPETGSRQAPLPSQARVAPWLMGLVLVAGLLILALAIALLVVLNRLRRDRQALATPAGVTAPVPLPVLPVEPLAPVRVPRAPPSLAPRPPAVSTDALDGANIYIAYGRFSEAVGALRAALDKEPERTDLRFRLLEVLAELGDPAGYLEQQAILREAGFSEVQLQDLQSRYPRLAMAAPLAPALPATQAVAAAAPASNELLDDFQLNLDDLSLDADWDKISPFQQGHVGRKKPADVPTPMMDDPTFLSNLSVLPEVFELSEQDSLAHFPSAAAEPPPQELLAEEFSDAFSALAAESLAPGSSLDSDLDHLAADREHLSKLNLALAYISQSDIESACNILNQVLNEGDDQQKQEARELLARIA